MDPTGNFGRPFTRGIKRISDEMEAKLREAKDTNKRQQKMFGPRLTSSATSYGLCTLIRPLDILVNSNLPKIQIPLETEVKSEIKMEETPDDEGMEVNQSTTSLQDSLPFKTEMDSEDKVGGTDQQRGVGETGEINVQMDSDADVEYSTEVVKGENEVEEELKTTSFQNLAPFNEEEISGSDLPAEIEDNEVVRSMISVASGSRNADVPVVVGAISSIQMECNRCPVLEKNLEEKDLRILELEAQLKSQKQKVEELSKTEGSIPNANAEGEDEMSSDMNVNQDNDLEEDEDGNVDCSVNPIFQAISNGMSKEKIQELLEMGENWKQKDDEGNSVLHLAARSGNTELLKFFISLGASVNEKNSAGSTPLMEAAKAQNFSEIVDVLVMNWANLRTKNKSGENALSIALKARKSAEEIAKVCFDSSKRSKIRLQNTADADGNTILHRAASSGDLEFLEYLVSLKPNVNLRNGEGRTPLMCAVDDAKENFSSVVDALMMGGANIHAFDVIVYAIMSKKPVQVIEKLLDVGAEWRKQTVVYYCVRYEHVEALKYFIRKGGAVNGPSEEWPCLMQAVCTGNREMIDILIENGAEPLRGLCLSSSSDTFYWNIVGLERPVNALEELSRHGVTWDSDTAFHYFLLHGDLDGVRYCLQRGVNVNARDSRGRTPLLEAVLTRKPNLEKLGLLVENGANVNEVDHEGFSILHHATCNPYSSGSGGARAPLTVLEKLVILGATCTHGIAGNGVKKESILHAAVRRGQPEVVQFFISKGVDVNCRDSGGDTPFLRAVEYGGSRMQEILKMLVDAGADPNARDNEGNTALLRGVGDCSESRRLRLDEVKSLIAIGCDWKIRDNQGLTVICKVEIHKRYMKLLEYLKSLD